MEGKQNQQTHHHCHCHCHCNHSFASNVWHRRFNEVCWHRISKLFSILLLWFLWVCFLLSVFTLSSPQFPFFSANTANCWPMLLKSRTFNTSSSGKHKEKALPLRRTHNRTTEKDEMLKENHRKFKSVIQCVRNGWFGSFARRQAGGRKQSVNINLETEKRCNLICALFFSFHYEFHSLLGSNVRYLSRTIYFLNFLGI